MGKVESGSIGEKQVRYCSFQCKKVKCHGVCSGAFVFPDGSTTEIDCPVLSKALRVVAQ